MLTTFLLFLIIAYFVRSTLSGLTFRFPTVILLEKWNGEQWNHLCTASVIGSDSQRGSGLQRHVLLTAASCFDTAHTFDIFHWEWRLGLVRARFGAKSHYLPTGGRFSEDKLWIGRIARMLRHPKYKQQSPNSLQYDVALLLAMFQMDMPTGKIIFSRIERKMPSMWSLSDQIHTIAWDRTVLKKSEEEMSYNQNDCSTSIPFLCLYPMPSSPCTSDLGSPLFKDYQGTEWVNQIGLRTAITDDSCFNGYKPHAYVNLIPLTRDIGRMIRYLWDQEYWGSATRGHR